ncbi:hypothetical protein UPYG_G00030910 [Umbra pygmaea]|uniref:Uncharacterized protein n=1 Tax=Umbra pygmaea TaxID=75934 RepID=A0ABD0XMQ5_UMBPY
MKQSWCTKVQPSLTNKPNTCLQRRQPRLSFWEGETTGKSSPERSIPLRGAPSYLSISLFCQEPFFFIEQDATPNDQVLSISKDDVRYSQRH